MSEPPSESSGLTSGDPLSPGGASEGRRDRGPDEPRSAPSDDALADASAAGGAGPTDAPPHAATPPGSASGPTDGPPRDATPAMPRVDGAGPTDAPPRPPTYVAPREAPEPEHLGGYTSAPPPGAYGGAPVPAPPFAAGALELAGWWSRVWAALLDGLIIGVGGLLLMALFGAVFSVGFFASDEAGVISVIVGLMLAFGAFAIVSLLYAPLMMARTNGQTLGRMALGIRVVRANGHPMTFGWAMLREVAVKWLLFGVVGGSFTFGLASLLDVLWPLWDDENRALHDFLVDTRVVRD